MQKYNVDSAIVQVLGYTNKGGKVYMDAREAYTGKNIQVSAPDGPIAPNGDWVAYTSLPNSKTGNESFVPPNSLVTLTCMHAEKGHIRAAAGMPLYRANPQLTAFVANMKLLYARQPTADKKGALMVRIADTDSYIVGDGKTIENGINLALSGATSETLHRLESPRGFGIRVTEANNAGELQIKEYEFAPNMRTPEVGPEQVLSQHKNAPAQSGKSQNYYNYAKSRAEQVQARIASGNALPGESVEIFGFSDAFHSTRISENITGQQFSPEEIIQSIAAHKFYRLAEATTPDIYNSRDFGYNQTAIVYDTTKPTNIYTSRPLKNSLGSPTSKIVDGTNLPVGPINIGRVLASETVIKSNDGTIKRDNARIWFSPHVSVKNREQGINKPSSYKILGHGRIQSNFGDLISSVNPGLKPVNPNGIYIPINQLKVYDTALCALTSAPAIYIDQASSGSHVIGGHVKHPKIEALIKTVLGDAASINSHEGGYVFKADKLQEINDTLGDHLIYPPLLKYSLETYQLPNKFASKKPLMTKDEWLTERFGNSPDRILSEVAPEICNFLTANKVVNPTLPPINVHGGRKHSFKLANVAGDGGPLKIGNGSGRHLCSINFHQASGTFYAEILRFSGATTETVASFNTQDYMNKLYKDDLAQGKATTKSPEELARDAAEAKARQEAFLAQDLLDRQNAYKSQLASASKAQKDHESLTVGTGYSAYLARKGLLDKIEQIALGDSAIRFGQDEFGKFISNPAYDIDDNFVGYQRIYDNPILKASAASFLKSEGFTYESTGEPVSISDIRCNVNPDTGVLARIKRGRGWGDTNTTYTDNIIYNGLGLVLDAKTHKVFNEDRTPLIVDGVDVYLSSNNKLLHVSEPEFKDKDFNAGFMKKRKDTDEYVGTHFKLGNIDNASTIYLGEGYATVATALVANPSAAGISALDSGNLTQIAGMIKEKYPNAECIVIADNDIHKPHAGNAGVRAALEISRKHDIDFITPKFSKEEIAGGATDINDKYEISGIYAVEQTLLQTTEQAPKDAITFNKVLSKHIGNDAKLIDKFLNSALADIKASYPASNDNNVKTMLLESRFAGEPQAKVEADIKSLNEAHQALAINALKNISSGTLTSLDAVEQEPIQSATTTTTAQAQKPANEQTTPDSSEQAKVQGRQSPILQAAESINSANDRIVTMGNGRLVVHDLSKLEDVRSRLNEILGKDGYTFDNTLNTYIFDDENTDIVSRFFMDAENKADAIISFKDDYDTGVTTATIRFDYLNDKLFDSIADSLRDNNIDFNIAQTTIGIDKVDYRFVANVTDKQSASDISAAVERFITPYSDELGNIAGLKEDFETPKAASNLSYTKVVRSLGVPSEEEFNYDVERVALIDELKPRVSKADRVFLMFYTSSRLKNKDATGEEVLAGAIKDVAATFNTPAQKRAFIEAFGEQDVSDCLDLSEDLRIAQEERLATVQKPTAMFDNNPKFEEGLLALAEGDSNVAAGIADALKVDKNSLESRPFILGGSVPVKLNNGDALIRNSYDENTKGTTKRSLLVFIEDFKPYIEEHGIIGLDPDTLVKLGVDEDFKAQNHTDVTVYVEKLPNGRYSIKDMYSAAYALQEDLPIKAYLKPLASDYDKLPQLVTEAVKKAATPKRDANYAIEEPLFPEEIDDMSTFLGVYENRDLLAISNNVETTVVARYGSDGDYHSSLTFASRNKYLLEAVRRGVETGLIDFDKEPWKSELAETPEVESFIKADLAANNIQPGINSSKLLSVEPQEAETEAVGTPLAFSESKSIETEGMGLISLSEAHIDGAQPKQSVSRLIIADNPPIYLLGNPGSSMKFKEWLVENESTLKEGGAFGFTPELVVSAAESYYSKTKTLVADSPRGKLTLQEKRKHFIVDNGEVITSVSTDDAPEDLLAAVIDTGFLEVEGVEAPAYLTQGIEAHFTTATLNMDGVDYMYRFFDMDGVDDVYNTEYLIKTGVENGISSEFNVVKTLRELKINITKAADNKEEVNKILSDFSAYQDRLRDAIDEVTDPEYKGNLKCDISEAIHLDGFGYDDGKSLVTAYKFEGDEITYLAGIYSEGLSGEVFDPEPATLMLFNDDKEAFDYAQDMRLKAAPNQMLEIDASSLNPELYDDRIKGLEHRINQSIIEEDISYLNLMFHHIHRTKTGAKDKASLNSEAIEEVARQKQEAESLQERIESYIKDDALYLYENEAALNADIAILAEDKSRPDFKGVKSLTEVAYVLEDKILRKKMQRIENIVKNHMNEYGGFLSDFAWSDEMGYGSPKENQYEARQILQHFAPSDKDSTIESFNMTAKDKFISYGIKASTDFDIYLPKYRNVNAPVPSRLIAATEAIEPRLLYRDSSWLNTSSSFEVTEISHPDNTGSLYTVTLYQDASSNNVDASFVTMELDSVEAAIEAFEAAEQADLSVKPALEQLANDGALERLTGNTVYESEAKQVKTGNLDNFYFTTVQSEESGYESVYFSKNARDALHVSNLAVNQMAFIHCIDPETNTEIQVPFSGVDLNLLYDHDFLIDTNDASLEQFDNAKEETDEDLDEEEIPSQDETVYQLGKILRLEKADVENPRDKKYVVRQHEIESEPARYKKVEPILDGDTLKVTFRPIDKPAPKITAVSEKTRVLNTKVKQLIENFIERKNSFDDLEQALKASNISLPPAVRDKFEQEYTSRFNKRHFAQPEAVVTEDRFASLRDYTAAAVNAGMSYPEFHHSLFDNDGDFIESNPFREAIAGKQMADSIDKKAIMEAIKLEGFGSLSEFYESSFYKEHNRNSYEVNLKRHAKFIPNSFDVRRPLAENFEDISGFLTQRDFLNTPLESWSELESFETFIENSDNVITKAIHPILSLDLQHVNAEDITSQFDIEDIKFLADVLGLAVDPDHNNNKTIANDILQQYRTWLSIHDLSADEIAMIQDDIEIVDEEGFRTGEYVDSDSTIRGMLEKLGGSYHDSEPAKALFEKVNDIKALADLRLKEYAFVANAVRLEQILGTPPEFVTEQIETLCAGSKSFFNKSKHALDIASESKLASDILKASWLLKQALPFEQEIAREMLVDAKYRGIEKSETIMDNLKYVYRADKDKLRDVSKFKLPSGTSYSAIIDKEHIALPVALTFEEASIGGLLPISDEAKASVMKPCENWLARNGQLCFLNEKVSGQPDTVTVITPAKRAGFNVSQFYDGKLQATTKTLDVGYYLSQGENINKLGTFVTLDPSVSQYVSVLSTEAANVLDRDFSDFIENGDAKETEKTISNLISKVPELANSLPSEAKSPALREQIINATRTFVISELYESVKTGGNITSEISETLNVLSNLAPEIESVSSNTKQQPDQVETSDTEPQEIKSDASKAQGSITALGYSKFEENFNKVFVELDDDIDQADKDMVMQAYEEHYLSLSQLEQAKIGANIAQHIFESALNKNLEPEPAAEPVAEYKQVLFSSGGKIYSGKFMLADNPNLEIIPKYGDVENESIESMIMRPLAFNAKKGALSLDDPKLSTTYKDASKTEKALFLASINADNNTEALDDDALNNQIARALRTFSSNKSKVEGLSPSLHEAASYIDTICSHESFYAVNNAQSDGESASKITMDKTDNHKFADGNASFELTQPSSVFTSDKLCEDSQAFTERKDCDVESIIFLNQFSEKLGMSSSTALEIIKVADAVPELTIETEIKNGSVTGIKLVSNDGMSSDLVASSDPAKEFKKIAELRSTKHLDMTYEDMLSENISDSVELGATVYFDDGGELGKGTVMSTDMKNNIATILDYETGATINADVDSIVVRDGIEIPKLQHEMMSTYIGSIEEFGSIIEASIEGIDGPSKRKTSLMAVKQHFDNAMFNIQMVDEESTYQVLIDGEAGYVLLNTKEHELEASQTLEALPHYSTVDDLRKALFIDIQQSMMSKAVLNEEAILSTSDVDTSPAYDKQTKIKDEAVRGPSIG